MPPWAEICNELDWRLFRVNEDYFSKREYGFCGVYRIFALAVERDPRKPSVLNRLRGQDSSGTLYIGRSASLQERLNKFQRTLFSGESSHGAASMLKRVDVFGIPSTKLGIALMFTPECIARVERDLLDAYIYSFGDTPPLNYSL